MIWRVLVFFSTVQRDRTEIRILMSCFRDVKCWDAFLAKSKDPICTHKKIPWDILRLIILEDFWHPWVSQQKPNNSNILHFHQVRSVQNLKDRNNAWQVAPSCQNTPDRCLAVITSKGWGTLEVSVSGDPRNQEVLVGCYVIFFRGSLWLSPN